MKNLMTEGSCRTRDTFYHGRITVFQEKKGYRFSVDAPILADFLPHARSPALEVGTGCGIISLLCCHQGKFGEIIALELQESLKKLADVNVEANGFGNRIRTVLGDIRWEGPRFHGIREVFSNPPFFSADRGKVSPHPQIRMARSDQELKIDELIKAVQNLLGPRGHLYLIFPSSREEELMAAAIEEGFFPGRYRRVHPRKGERANRFLVQLCNYSTSRREEEPLVVFQPDGSYTEEMEKIISG